MRYARATMRLLGLIAITAGCYLRWLVVAPFLVDSKHLALAWRNRTIRGWAVASVRIMGMRISAHNSPPAGPFLLVSNHLSYVDIVVLASQVDCAFIAKTEVKSWPLLGLICRTMDTIFVDRKLKKDVHRVMGQIDRTLREGLGVVLFAEGTSSNGQTVLPFKTSLLELAARKEIPVHYASIRYAAPRGEASADRAVCWWGDMTFPDHLFRLLQMASFEANLVYGSEPIIAGDRRVLAAKLWSAVSSQLNATTEQA
jgi:1-acyl-sn-glycerol-3-phosphate acyltransferase